jgi:hypothetical protein
MTCDLCDAPLANCPPFATWCVCGLYYQACEACCKNFGASVKGRARVAHEKRRHETEVGR